jgi:superfamily I DNA/RNA helicase
MTPEQLNSKYEFSKFHIQANYRSPKTIVDLSNQFAQNFKTFEFSAAVPKRDHIPRSVVINEYGHIQDELGAVANEIYALKQQGVPLHDIMVLARSNRTLSAMEPHMLRLGIPYRLKFDNRSPINHSSFRFLYAVYSVVLNPNDVPSLSEMFEACKGFGDKYLLNAQQAIRESTYLQQFSVQAKIATLNQALEKVGNSKQRAQAKSIIDNFMNTME